MKLLIVCAVIAIAAAAPGLLRVPKVYNVVITSNQNLSPSRAFPVIQPVIHRTAVGYVPPFYYTQIAPHFAGSQVTHYPPLVAAGGKPSGKDPVQASPSTSSSTSRLVESTSFGIGKQHDRRKEEDTTRNGDSPKHSPKKNGQVPLSFYPSYHSFYYEPYNVYTYNGFNSHLVPPGTYYIDYQPYGSLEPIPATTPKNADSGHLLPSFHDERRDRTKNEEEEKIPDVPPPPLPSSVPKRA
ncbi:uncharacterized protein LOC105280746 [Ooceraea biroi]|nr:uncharacterized protein LOC105280746 [Ooceraea biroi]EZA53710.1 hypothetical protein X777_06817 [Ooceraea biroi]